MEERTNYRTNIRRAKIGITIPGKMTRKWTHLMEVSLQLGLSEIFWSKGVSYRGRKWGKEKRVVCTMYSKFVGFF